MGRIGERNECSHGGFSCVNVKFLGVNSEMLRQTRFVLQSSLPCAGYRMDCTSFVSSANEHQAGAALNSAHATAARRSPKGRRGAFCICSSLPGGNTSRSPNSVAARNAHFPLCCSLAVPLGDRIVFSRQRRSQAPSMTQHTTPRGEPTHKCV